MGIGKGTGRGGVRAGAGRKTPDGVVASYKISITVDAECYNVLQQYLVGDNFSAAVRSALRELNKYKRGGAVVKSGKVKRVPIYKEPSEYTPDGVRRSISTMIRLRREAQEAYEAELQSVAK